MLVSKRRDTSAAEWFFAKACRDHGEPVEITTAQITPETDSRPEERLRRSVVLRGHAFVQNLRRDHYELVLEVNPTARLEAAFDELLPTIRN